MGDPEGDHPASKKRVAGRQISKENPELDDDGPEPEMGTFKKASDEVLATRRIVKVRRTQPPPAATSNPFASLHMVPLSNSIANATSPSDYKAEVKNGPDEEHGKNGEDKGTEIGTSFDETNGNENINKKAEDKTDVSSANDDDKVEGEAVEKAIQLVESEKNLENGEEGTAEKAREETAKENKEETETENSCEEKAGKETMENANKDVDADKPVPSLSSFQQLSSSQNAFTGLAGTGFGTSSFSFGSISKEGPTFSASCFGVGGSNNGNVTKSVLPSLQEVAIETGEENEKAVFTTDAILYEYFDGGWKERGKGELKLNISTSDVEKARLIMRARGNYRLILNASLYPDMVLTSMDKKGVTFACINSAGEGKDGLATFALKFKDGSFVEEFRRAVAAHKGKKTAVLKTPENSP